MRNLPKQLQNWLILWLDSNGKDLSWNQNNWTLVNAPTKVRVLQNDGLSYNGSNQYVNCPSINNSNFTISIWASLTSLSTQYAIFSKYYIWTDAQTSWFIDTYLSNTFRLWINSWWVLYTTSLTFAPIINKLYLLTGTYDWTTLKLYINWNFNNSVSSPAPNISTTPIFVGAFSWTSPWAYAPMKWLNPMIWNRALSATEIQQLYYSQWIK